MPDPMKIRATVIGEVVEVKVLMAHPMETGQRKDADGKLVPARFITSVQAHCNERVVLSADWGPSVSKNPFLAFRLRGVAKGDKISISWTDTAGESRTDEAQVV